MIKKLLVIGVICTTVLTGCAGPKEEEQIILDETAVTTEVVDEDVVAETVSDSTVSEDVVEETISENEAPVAVEDAEAPAPAVIEVTDEYDWGTITTTTVDGTSVKDYVVDYTDVNGNRVITGFSTDLNITEEVFVIENSLILKSTSLGAGLTIWDGGDISDDSAKMANTEQAAIVRWAGEKGTLVDGTFNQVNTFAENLVTFEVDGVSYKTFDDPSYLVANFRDVYEVNRCYQSTFVCKAGDTTTVEAGRALMNTVRFK